MRGIPREVVKKNLPIKGTKYFARDIANIKDTCSWSTLNYGIDMDKPWAQEYYNSVLELLAGWGVDFIKYDDIVPFPEEAKAVANAIEQCGRPMILSLSQGGNVNGHLKGTCIRTTTYSLSRRIRQAKPALAETTAFSRRSCPAAGEDDRQRTK